jgi:aspartyl-tRNA(Asn)/glutamyl-tRNA(Gln) amidotransferase subunit C
VRSFARHALGESVPGAKENAGYDTLSLLFFRTDSMRFFLPRRSRRRVRREACDDCGARHPRRPPNARNILLRPRFPMSLAPDDIQRLAHLARIDIDAEALRDVRAKLEAIFGLIDELRAIDTTGVEPMAHAQDAMLALREDTVTERDRHAEYQRAAPAVAEGLYLVPKVIE